METEENKIIRITVLGDPVALKRHRTVKLPNGRMMQMDPSTGDKQDFLESIQVNAPEEIPTCPIKLTMKFAFTRPKSHFGTGRNEGKLKGSAPLYHTKRPDLDNLVKFVKDALNGIYWKDDSQVMSFGPTNKYYAIKQAMTVVEIEYITE